MVRSFYNFWKNNSETLSMEEFLFLQVVVCVEHFVTFLGHMVFLLLTRPNAQNKNFPFHVRTTQIGILQAISNHNNRWRTFVINFVLDQIWSLFLNWRYPSVQTQLRYKISSISAAAIPHLISPLWSETFFYLYVEI